MKRFGEIVVEEGYATEEQIENALNYQKSSENLLGRIMVDMGFLTSEEKEECMTIAKSPEAQGMRFGEICVSKGYTSREHVDKALDFQKKAKGFLGEILIELGLLTPEQKESCLKLQLES